MFLGEKQYIELREAAKQKRVTGGTIDREEVMVSLGHVVSMQAADVGFTFFCSASRTCVMSNRRSTQHGSLKRTSKRPGYVPRLSWVCLPHVVVVGVCWVGKSAQSPQDATCKP
jgi:hypothetical protein